MLSIQRAEALMGPWRRHDRRRQLKSNVLPLLLGIAVWFGLGLVVLIGILRLSQL